MIRPALLVLSCVASNVGVPGFYGMAQVEPLLAFNEESARLVRFADLPSNDVGFGSMMNRVRSNSLVSSNGDDRYSEGRMPCVPISWMPDRVRDAICPNTTTGEDNGSQKIVIDGRAFKFFSQFCNFASRNRHADYFEALETDHHFVSGIVVQAANLKTSGDRNAPVFVNLDLKNLTELKPEPRPTLSGICLFGCNGASHRRLSRVGGSYSRLVAEVDGEQQSQDADNAQNYAPIGVAGRFLSGIRSAPLLAKIGLAAIYGAVAYGLVAFGTSGVFMPERVRSKRAAVWLGCAMIVGIGMIAIASTAP